MSIKWIDITDIIKEQSKKLTQITFIEHQKFSLEQSMSATQISDFKMDIRTNITIQDTYQYLLKNNIFKHPSQLTLPQICSIYDRILYNIMLWMEGQPYTHTIYTFVYLYQQWQKLPIYFGAVIDFMVYSLAKLVEIVKNASCIRQDDYNPTFIFFKNNDQKEQQINKGLNDTIKYFNDLQSGNIEMIGILKNRIKLMKLICSLSKLLSQKLVKKLHKNITGCLDNFNKLLNVIQQQKYEQKNVDNYFNPALLKTILSHISPRVIKSIKKNQFIQKFLNLISQLKLVLQLSNLQDVFQIIDGLNNFFNFPINIIAKSFLQINIFETQNYYFNELDITTLIKNNLKTWTNLNQLEVANLPQYIQLIEKLVLIVQQIFFKHIVNKCKNHKQLRHLYQGCSYIIHITVFFYHQNKFEQKRMSLKLKQTNVIKWGYHIAFGLMTRHLQLGFQLDLYNQEEYPYIYYYLTYLYNLYNKNIKYTVELIEKENKEFVLAFMNDTKDKKSRKKITNSKIKVYIQTHYIKAKYFLFKSLSQLCFILRHRKILNTMSTQQEKIKYKQRLKIFQKCFYIKDIKYQSYIKEVEEYENSQEEKLFQIQEFLKEAKRIFLKLNAMDGISTFFRSKSSCSQLAKAAVKLGLLCMRIKQNKNIQVKWTKVCNFPMLQNN